MLDKLLKVQLRERVLKLVDNTDNIVGLYSPLKGQFYKSN